MRISLVLTAVALGACLVPAGAAGAQSRRLVSFWVIEPAPPPAGIRHLGGKGEVLRQRLLPSGLAELARTWSDSEAEAELPAGTQLIEASSDAGAVYCEGDIRGFGSDGLICFLDSDRDGRFESRTRAVSSTPALVMLTGRMKALVPLAEPLEYRIVDPKASRIPAFVAIERRNYFNIYSRENFMIVFGTGDEKKRITDPVHFKAADMPKELTILGARFTALGETDGKMAIEVHSGMPAQPFAVMSTVTYR